MRAALAALAVLTGCAGDDPAWTVEQAESIGTVRGTPVHDAECRGKDPGDGDRFHRFTCVAAARRPGETFDSVAVHYVLVPRERYEGVTSDHDLANVRFIGGPGIP